MDTAHTRSLCCSHSRTSALRRRSHRHTRPSHVPLTSRWPENWNACTGASCSSTPVHSPLRMSHSRMWPLSAADASVRSSNWCACTSSMCPLSRCRRAWVSRSHTRMFLSPQPATMRPSDFSNDRLLANIIWSSPTVALRSHCQPDTSHSWMRDSGSIEVDAHSPSCTWMAEMALPSSAASTTATLLLVPSTTTRRESISSWAVCPR
mmetsp:Transcript_7383/g.18336  ORF Transcript_7383/g.18336 Transcript_7383/m.18336 type:complete len:207 (+) Transcript_7383:1430-2050(+)